MKKIIINRISYGNLYRALPKDEVSNKLININKPKK